MLITSLTLKLPKNDSGPFWLQKNLFILSEGRERKVVSQHLANRRRRQSLYLQMIICSPSPSCKLLIFVLHLASGILQT